MTDQTSDFRKSIRARRPDMEAHVELHAEKRARALRLRRLRKAKRMTTADVAKVSGMTTEEVDALEASSGPMPDDEAIKRYLDAC